MEEGAPDSPVIQYNGVPRESKRFLVFSNVNVI